MKTTSHYFVCFLLFLASNTILSYAPLSLEAKLWIGLVGLALPFLWAWKSSSKSPSKPTFHDTKEYLPLIPLWAWILLGVGAAFLRFYKLNTLSVWPHYDEGVYGYYAIQLNQHWSWRLFYGDSRVPPLYIWLLSLCFRLFGTSLTTLWAFPAFVSTLVVPAAYLAARQFFSRSFSFLAVTLMASGFWPLLLGRFSFMTGLVLLAECGVFYLLGKFLHAPSLNMKKKAALALGFLMGVGFLIHIHWPVVIAVVLGTLLADLLVSGKSSRRAAPYWLFPFLVLASPILVLEWSEGYGPYLLHLAAFHQTNSPGEQLAISLSYLSALFWGVDTTLHTYQPVWGGFLNPVLSSFFFMGALVLVRNPRVRLHFWLLLALGFFLLPGILTSDREYFRMVPMIPVLLAVVALGWRSLLSTLPRGRVLAALLLPLAVSLGLDAYHLFGAYHSLWDSPAAWKGYVKSVERFRAYQLLRQIASEKGPGLIFTDFVPGLPNQTLKVASYGFNAAENPGLDPGQAHWAAVLTNVNERPFLVRRFPDGKDAWLSKGEDAPDGGFMLWVMPLNPDRRNQLENWRRADLALKPCLDEEIGYAPGRSFSDALRVLDLSAVEFQSDPFLRSCFLEISADLLFKDYAATGDGQKLKQSARALEEALRQGYPSAHLYMRLGVFELMEGNKAKARRAFEMAVKAPGNRTEAARFLQDPQGGSEGPRP